MGSSDGMVNGNVDLKCDSSELRELMVCICHVWMFWCM